MPPATTSAQAQTNLQNYASQMQTPTQEIQTADQSLGVNQAQQQVTGLQGAIANTTNLLQQVAPTVMGNAENSLVTQSQANQQISNASAPLNTQLTNQTNSYNQANSNYTNLEGQAQNLANANLSAQQGQESYLQSIYNDLYTQEQNAQQAATQQQQYEQSLQETEANNAAVNANAAEANKISEENASAPTPAEQLQSDVSTMFSSAGGYNSADKSNFYTEKTIIPKLESLYPDLSAAQVKQEVYAYRLANLGY